MAINTSNIVSEIANSYNNKTEKTQSTKSYGKTVGEPKLSEEAEKYYQELKKKFSNMDFILVSRDEKANAQAKAASYANPAKTVVLIDEDKIERMATDASYRSKYESIIANANSGISDMKSKLESSGANVQGYGISVNDDGTSSLFAVLKKSSADQKARIEKKAAENKEARKVAKKKEAKRLEEKRREVKKMTTGETEEIDTEDEYITITANYIEELMKKISDYQMEALSDSVMTEEELMVGQHIDFRG